MPADKMPIYCINNTNHSRKKSKSLIHEVIGANNYYINNNNNNTQPPPLSTASQHVLSSKAASANKSASTSLIMAINRFKNSVKDMKDTVLIPTRLSDLIQKRSEELSETTTEESGESLGCCASIGGNSLSSIALSPSTQLSATESYSTSSPGATLLSHHNLYEQYKLLDLIDKILSSDTVVTVSHGGYKRHHNGSPFALPNSLDNDDNNNNKHGSEKDSVDESATTLEDGRTESAAIVSTGGAPIDTRRELNGKLVSCASLEATNELNEPNNGHIDAYHTSLPDCSLIKIKEKLEYHLVSLKNILNVMSNSAEYITQTYLEDIHCEDRFSDKQAKLSETNESGVVMRHYYTCGGPGGGTGPTAGF